MIATSSSHAIAASLMRTPTFDPIGNYTPITLVGEVPMVIAVHPAFRVQSLPELITMMKQESRGAVSYAFSGVAGIAHFTAELLMRQAGGLLMTQIPYRGAGPALQDLLAGHLPLYVDTFATTLEHHRAGQLRIIANFSRTRSPAAPDVPTAIEAGVPDMVANTYNAFLAPAAIPLDVKQALFDAAQAAMADPAFQQFLIGVSVQPMLGISLEPTREYMQAELLKWRPIIQATGMTMD